MKSGMRILAVVLLGLLLAGCQQLPGAGTADTLGPDLELMSQRIAAASSATAVATLQSDLSSMRKTALSDSRYSKYLRLIDAQNLTLQVLATYMEFKTEGAKLGTHGVDCAKNYGSFLASLESVNATAASAVSATNAWLASSPNSTAKLLITAVNRTGPAGMSAYAEILRMELGKNCLAVNKPNKTYAAPLSKADALEIASGLAGYTYFVYGFDAPLPAGTVITAPRASEDHNFTLQKESWFFFLDSQPWAPFGHPALYVIIDTATGEYAVANETMYPEIGGVPHWMSVEERSNPANVLYPPDAADILGMTFSLSEAKQSPYILTLGPPLAGELGAANVGRTQSELNCCPEKKKYAIIMVGSNDSMFEADGVRMYNYLLASGYKDEDIEYLDALDIMPHHDAKTTPATFKAAMEKVIAKAECCDDVFMFLAGHGSQAKIWQYKHKTTGEIRWVRSLADLPSPADWDATGREEYNHRIQVNPYLGGGRMRSDEITPYLGKMKSCYIEVLYASCYSGAATNDLAMPGVLVMTPVDGEHVSYGTNGAFGGFETGLFFTQLYTRAKGNESGIADANRDGKVTEKEAFDYADKRNREAIENERSRLINCFNTEADLAKKQRCLQMALSLEPQVGQYSDGGPCYCCYVDCNETSSWKCSVFAGRNQPNCDECAGKKIGDICRAVTVIPPQENGTGGANQTPPTGNATNATGPTETVPGVCGDGKTTGNEGCDYGNASTNKCPEGTYCTETCACKKLETSVVCGDGKISSPNEDCDGGNVRTKICKEGYTCSICKCVPSTATAQCGDGRVTAPEECDHGNTFTSKCPGAKTCSNCRCVDYSQVQTHRACVNEACVSVDGAGEDSCSVDADCAEEAICGDGKISGNEQCDPQASPTGCSEGKMCSGCTCIDRPVSCGDGKISGNEQCERDADCTTGYYCSGCMCYRRAPVCGDGTVNGNEQCDPQASPTGCNEGTVCGSNCQCVSPPSLDCGYICGQTSGAQSLGGSYGSQSECTNAAKAYYSSTMCYLTCSYAYYYRVTNIAGSASCCCAMKKMFQCSDCPGQNPQCPSESTCQQSAPSWYSPPS